MIVGNNYLHYDLSHYGTGETIQVTLQYAAWVRLMDYDNYMRYLRGQQYRFFGGYVNRSPYRIKPPYLGNWHLVIDLNGQPGQISATVQIFR